jgi:hypothetical protein
VIVQPRQSSLDVSPGSTPKHFSRSSGTGPDNGIDIIRGRLFGPQELLATEDEITLGFSHVGVGIERVSLGFVVSLSASKGGKAKYLLPGLEWVTPAVSSCKVAKPCSGTTILGNGKLP